MMKRLKTKIEYNYISLLLLTFMIPLTLFIMVIKTNSYMIIDYETQKNMISMSYILIGILIINFIFRCRIYNDKNEQVTYDFT